MAPSFETSRLSRALSRVLVACSVAALAASPLLACSQPGNTERTGSTGAGGAVTTAATTGAGTGVTAGSSTTGGSGPTDGGSGPTGGGGGPTDGGDDSDAAVRPCGQLPSGGYVWPNSCSSANSDPWIAQHHDEIVEEHPVALVIDFANAFTTYNGVRAAAGYDLATVVNPLVQKHIDAFKVASMYHGYNDGTAPPFKSYSVLKVVDARDDNGQNNSSLIPVHVSGPYTNVDYAQFAAQAWTDRIAVPDPQNPGKNLSICELFEKGIIHEVWGMVADPVAQGTAKFDESAETKQAYDANNQPVAGRLVAVSNGQDITKAIPCKVSTRFYDFNPTRGPGCHLHANGHAWENYITSHALPAFAKVAQTFFNFDFATRFKANFNSFYDVCPYTAAVCINWQPTAPFAAASAGPAASPQGWTFSPLTAGCGNVHFPPNATTEYNCLDQGYDIPQTPNSAPVQNQTLSSCEHYGLHDGDGGADMTTPYSNALAAIKYKQALGANASMVATDCGGPQPTYIFASMPGLGNKATAADGTPMKNWWVYEFY